MRLLIDTRNVEYSVTRNPEPRMGQDGKQRFNKDGAPMWQTQLQALDDTGAEILMVTTMGEKPKVAVRQVVAPVGLEAFPWNQNGRSGVAYRASELAPASK